ncbi:MAG TPA: DedA family protein/thiosulfate sulfurtransferase GlpE [Verrucomicrobiae bacterium]|jgi:membrane protein DedA with SNARE-associated domain/rhodanese-related sulfurtransferase|nr:DedA family protein/thiosulfate sulfurtransferase GlpE [Verrucomicrobiae bacterium]
MTDTRQFLIKHGAPVLFGAVFVEQIGLPIPALPWMLAVGALAATGGFNSAVAISVTMAACVLADSIWFYLGRFRGNQVLNLLCRISLEPDSCVRRTQNAFTRWGWRGIVVAKFVPGLSTMAPPIAGMSRMNAGRFILIDCLGSMLYAGCFIYAGYFFSAQINQIEGAFAHIGGSALCLILGIIAAYIAYKYLQRKRLLDQLRMSRITVADLRQMQDAGETPVILDLRSVAELDNDPVLIQGAIHLTMDDVKERRYKIPAGSDVIVYCSCPNEVTSARVALLLRRQGFTRVRPLLGGLDAWRDQKYPLIKRTPTPLDAPQ